MVVHPFEQQRLDLGHAETPHAAGGPVLRPFFALFDDVNAQPPAPIERVEQFVQPPAALHFVDGEPGEVAVVECGDDGGFEIAALTARGLRPAAGERLPNPRRGA